VGLILDSSVVIAAERQGQTAYEMLQAIGEQAGGPEVAVPVLELAHGIARANTGARRATRQKFLDDLLIGMPVQAAGTRVALADLLIGTTALVLGHAVETGNTRHFEMIPGLVVRPF
jgi:predicted nucleic acid-binding protein